MANLRVVEPLAFYKSGNRYDDQIHSTENQKAEFQQVAASFTQAISQLGEAARNASKQMSKVAAILAFHSRRIRKGRSPERRRFPIPRSHR